MDRYEARLAALSRAALIELAAALCRAHAAEADALLAKHSPFPAWARGALLSDDLLPGVVAPLEAKHGAAAATCRALKAAWDATDATRRGLRPAAEQPPPHLETSGHVAPLPNGTLFASRPDMSQPARILDASIQTVKTLDGVNYVRGAVASDLGLFVSSEGEQWCAELRRYALNDFSVAAARSHNEYESLNYLTLTPGNTLFAVGHDGDDDSHDELVCFNAQTLEVRFRSARVRFEAGVYGMAVRGDELFVSNRGAHSIDVFSFAGELQRSISGRFRRPQDLVAVEDRLYLLEEPGVFVPDRDDDEDEYPELGQMGRRIFALTPEGETLQVYRPRDLAACPYYDSMCIFGGRLLVRSIGPGQQRIHALRGI